MSNAYTDTLISWYREQSHRRELKDADVIETGYNPKCGDRITFFLKGDGIAIYAITYQPEACMLCTASTEAAVQAIPKNPDGLYEVADELKKAADHLFTGVMVPEIESVLKDTYSTYPARQTCLTLPWTTLADAIQKLADLD